MFNNFNLKNEEVIKIINDYSNLIKANSRIKNHIDEDFGVRNKIENIWGFNKKIEKILKKCNISKNFCVLIGK